MQATERRPRASVRQPGARGARPAPDTIRRFVQDVASLEGMRVAGVPLDRTLLRRVSNYWYGWIRLVPEVKAANAQWAARILSQGGVRTLEQVMGEFQAALDTLDAYSRPVTALA